MSEKNEHIQSDESTDSEKDLIIVNNDATKVISSGSTSQENGLSDIDSDNASYQLFSSRDADVTFAFMEKYDKEVPLITPKQEKHLRKKVAWIVVTLTGTIDFLLYSDKATLSYASIFELWKDTHLTQNRYNDANTLFYVGYIIGLLNLFWVQKFPIRRVMAFMCTTWTIIIFLHCTAYNYQGIYALRFFLGFVEAIAVPTLNITMNQFLTPNEKNAYAPLFYSSCIGCGVFVSLIAYGILHAHSTVHTWKLFMIIIGGMTLLTTLVVYYIYPSNPTDAKFLNHKERVWVIRRIQKASNSSIEQKRIKKYQVIETLKDPISWLFCAFFLLQQLANNLTYMQNILFENIGQISNLDTTIVSIASGGFASVCALIATVFLLYHKNFTAFSVVFWSLPSFAACIAMVSIPWGNNIALLAMLCLASPIFGIPWILMFSWSITSCAGYTKRITRNGMVMFWYCIANIISPQLWQGRDAPRFVPAWIVQIVLSFFLAPSLALVIWYILRRRNIERLRKLEKNGKNAKGYIEVDGENIAVDGAQLDLTDLENDQFIYPL
ncbi:similar to Saccharomyces cerevisiae YLL055W YCT1 High-affinity cysteine-specific transporter with similarity to the Dal5p family of transporters [Maudiozyma barnettii]|uniref:Similar to Saccharomyces cerevisiae YLL055W YCT1 High-affinity cysteine-specific transporter with similarity to the Dal5p family of transporters n=1 Tax=Maudiozyma barnettii TaxID=61262 RepID=A0A8H2VJB9_9SACH|nr:Yct1p [Kazachstania barnettii]CAB4256476.1 similar to Saccharomyces cerevisiae YLL055W YCT1 High-affinity cysteine-specific transporter with similarity to the Dal5p family of transporters [Kazachstania barnettii]CAD1785085.1 similar to Saccharomyces cerevisiae YLL055W YCT1 High-affinity cysteine-specific transporter with similarity to the Dal5p family of transporters [Kazachstania barnettii]